MALTLLHPLPSVASMNNLNVAEGIIWYLVFVFSTTLHEAAHAWTAYKLGDDTAYRGGQVSLDPTPHIMREPFGMVLAPLASFFFLGGAMVGWASAPYDPIWAIRHPRRAALKSLAGPLANLLLVLIAALGVRAGVMFHWFEAPDRIHYGEITQAVSEGAPSYCAHLLGVVFSLNLLLFSFNLIPVPPLDGSSLIFFFVNSAVAEKIFTFLHHPGLSMMGMFVAWKCFGPIFAVIQVFAVNLLYPGVHYV